MLLVQNAMPNEDARVTIRLMEGKKHVYQEFKEFVTEELHSDVCYVVTMLMEDFVNTMKEVPTLSTKMNLLKQDVTINKGPTNYYYYAKKPRRKHQLTDLQPAYIQCEILTCNQPAIHRFIYPNGFEHFYCKIHNTRAPEGYLLYEPIKPHTPPYRDKSHTIERKTRRKKQKKGLHAWFQRKLKGVRKFFKRK